MTLTDKLIIDELTGECEGHLTKREYNMVQLNKSLKLECINDTDIIKSKEKLAVFVRETFGSFNFTVYDKVMNFEYLFRFIYLCTFMNYKNYIVFGNAFGANKLATKKDLQELFKLKDQQFYNTVNYLEREKLIKFVDGNVVINKDVCIRGKISKMKSRKSARMFDDAIREIYEKSTSKEHKKLDLLIKLLPFVHYELNVIVHNPREQITDRIKAITLTELAEILGYSTTQRLKRNLFNITVSGQPVIMLATIENKSKIIINPRVYYKGNNLEEMKGLIKIFEVK